MLRHHAPVSACLNVAYRLMVSMMLTKPSSSISDSLDVPETSSPSACFSECTQRRTLRKEGHKNVSIDGAMILGAHLISEHPEISCFFIPNVLCMTNMSVWLAHEIQQ